MIKIIKLAPKLEILFVASWVMSGNEQEQIQQIISGIEKFIGQRTKNNQTGSDAMDLVHVVVRREQWNDYEPFNKRCIQLILEENYNERETYRQYGLVWDLMDLRVSKNYW